MIKFENLNINAPAQVLAEKVGLMNIPCGSAVITVSGNALRGKFSLVNHSRCIQASIVADGALTAGSSVLCNSATCVLHVAGEVSSTVNVASGATSVPLPLKVANLSDVTIDVGTTGLATAALASDGCSVTYTTAATAAGTVSVKVNSGKGILAEGTSSDPLNILITTGTEGPGKIKVPANKEHVQANARVNLVVPYDVCKPAPTYFQLGEKDIVASAS